MKTTKETSQTPSSIDDIKTDELRIIAEKRRKEAEREWDRRKQDLERKRK